MDERCSVEDCEKAVRSKGLCYAHYMRMYRNGTTDRKQRAVTDLTGKRFGTLVAQSRLDSGAWECICDCGRTATRRIGDLNRYGDAITCGDRPTHYRREVIAYHSAHRRVDADRGRAKKHKCADCGKPAAQWSYGHNDPDELIGTGWADGLPYSTKPEYYIPRCIPCHKRADLIRLGKQAR